VNAMKRTILTLSLILCLTPTLIFASDPPKPVIKNLTVNTVKSLIAGLESDNLGLKTSSAYMIGELEIKEAVIPLMKVLRNNENEQARIIAALSLYKIGSPTAIFAVKQASKFDKSERVRKMCFRFYADYLLKTNLEEI